MSYTVQQRRRNVNFFNDRKYSSAKKSVSEQICEYLEEKRTKRTPEQILEERMYYTSTR